MKARLAVEAGLPLPRLLSPSLFGYRRPCAKMRSCSPTHPYKVRARQARGHSHARTRFLESSWLARVELVLLIQEEKLEICVDCVKIIRVLSF